jgi:hypothetical protein
MKGSASKKIVAILDCICSGATSITKGSEEEAARLVRDAMHKKSKIFKNGEGNSLLAASIGYKEACGLKEKGHSIFTYYLLEGFGESRKAVDEEDNITPHSLGKYVYREFVNLPEDIRPKQKPIREVYLTKEYMSEPGYFTLVHRHKPSLPARKSKPVIY